MTTSPFRSKPVHLLSLALLAAVSAATALAWPQSQPAVVASSPDLAIAQDADPPDGAVEITGVSGATTWSDRGATVTVAVTNRGDSRTDAEVWWLLADPGSREPWAEAVAEGRRVGVTLAAGQSRQVDVPVRSRPRPGAWRLSLWTHTVTGGRTEHSHGVGATPLVHVLPTDRGVQRRGEPGGWAALSVVEPVGRLVTDGPDDAGITGPDALVSLRSTTQQPVEVSLRCYLAPPGTAEPWRDEQSVATPVTRVLLDAGEPQVQTCSFDRLPGEGDWQLSAFLRRGGEGSAGTHEDGLYSRRTVTFPPDSPFPPGSTVPPGNGTTVESEEVAAGGPGAAGRPSVR